MIYLLHSSIRIGGSGSNGSNHYIGYCEDGFLWERMKAHATGRNSTPIVQAFLAAGATVYLVRVWPDGGRALERHLKNRGHYKSHCPVCAGSLPQESAVSIVVASTLTARHVKLRSRKLMREALKSDPNGTLASKGGLSTQLVMQVPDGWSGSDGGLSLATPGGHGSPATVRTRGRGAKFVGTKPLSSGSGKTAASDSTPANQRRLHLVPLTEADYEHPPQLRLVDGEGFEV